MNSFVTTLTDCGMLISGVLVLVATEVLLAYTPTVPVFTSCDTPNGFGAVTACVDRATCWRRLALPPEERCAGAVRVAARFVAGAVTFTEGSSWLLPVPADCACAGDGPTSVAAAIASTLAADRN